MPISRNLCHRAGIASSVLVATASGATSVPARILGLDGYGLELGHKNWVLDGDVVYALQLDGRVLTVPAKGGATQVLGRLPGRIHPNAGLNRSADGAFVYATLTTYESELMLANLATH